MKKVNCVLGIVLVVLLAAIIRPVFAGSSGVSDPTITVAEFTPSGGQTFKDQVHASLDSLDTAVKAAIDVLDAIAGGTQSVALAPNKILVGNDASNQTAMAVTGDVTITQDGTNVTMAIAAGVIVNADVSAGAAIAATKISGTAVTYATAYQADTNTTTTTTGYTPAYIGQVLVGGAGEGTNGVWIAKGITTNDWVQVAP